MVDALASDRSDQPFGEAVLPRRTYQPAAVPQLLRHPARARPALYSRGALGISARADAVELISRRSHNSVATLIRLPGAPWPISRTRPLILRLPPRLRPVT